MSKTGKVILWILCVALIAAGIFVVVDAYRTENPNWAGWAIALIGVIIGVIMGVLNRKPSDKKENTPDNKKTGNKTQIVIEGKNDVSGNVAGGNIIPTNNYYPSSPTPSPPSSPPPPPVEAINHLPSRNEHFSGRKDILGKIAGAFDNSGNTVLIQSIKGLGGVGKTQTALEFTHRNKDKYPGGICWVNAESNNDLLKSFEEFAMINGQPFNENENKPEQAKAFVKRWFTTHSKWLVIFDNVSEEDISGYLPQGVGHVLLTTRNTDIGIACKREPLDIFKEDEAVDFLCNDERIRDRADQEKAGQIAERLGRLPLALAQAVAYMYKSGENFSSYLEWLDDEGLDVFKESKGKLTEDNYREIVTTTWEISFRKIDNEEAKRFLYLCAYTAPDSIPADILFGDAKHSSISRALSELYGYSLIERDKQNPNLVKIHRLVQEVIREKLKDNPHYLEACFDIFDPLIPEDFSKREYRDLFERISEHSQAVGGYYEKKFPDNEKQQKAAVLYFKIGRGYDNLGQYNKALAYYEKTKDISENVFGEAHSSTANIYNNIAGLYHAQGDYDKALAYNEKALVIYEKVLGAAHPNTATIWNNIAGVYDNLGEYDKALEYYEKAKTIREKVLGVAHPSTATTYNNIAAVYKVQGVYDKALAYFEKALDIKKKVLGVAHPDTATTWNNMAVVYHNMGEYDKALEYYGKAYPVYLKVLGAAHPYTKGTYDDMAATYAKSGKSAPFEDWLKERF